MILLFILVMGDLSILFFFSSAFQCLICHTVVYLLVVYDTCCSYLTVDYLLLFPDFFSSLNKVLYKSRCDNRLNEISERVSSDKREVSV